jgi:[acyl-carrier-protein] S-malonyltransferase
MAEDGGVGKAAPAALTRAIISQRAGMRAFIFPGQGSQSVGMGLALSKASAAARDVFQEVDEALGQNLFKLMTDGPEDELTLTANAQPAIMANAIATLRVLEREGGVRLAEKAAFVAGHSLGEYSALCAAGAIDLTTTARLLKTRGEAMQAAVPVGVGAMAVLLGLDFEAATKIAAEAAQGDVCAAANDNGGGQVVVSGHAEAIVRAMRLAHDHGAKHTIPLAVSAPFHCSLMEPAARVMADALATSRFQAPLVPLYANVTAAPVTDPATIVALLVEQVTATVRWRESVEAMVGAGVTQFVEFGGRVLGPMIRRITPEAPTRSLITMDDIEALLKEI